MPHAPLPRTIRPWTKCLSVLAVVIILVMGVVPPAMASEQDDTKKIEPALLSAISAKPDAKFKVIVTRAPAKDKNKRLKDKADLEQSVRNEGGRVGARLDIIEGHAATLPGKAVLKLAKNPNVRQIAPDRSVALLQVGGPNGNGLQSLQTQLANAPQVWSTYGNTGQGVTVAVLDSGVNTNQDIPGAAFGTDLTTGHTTLGDAGGHGTHVAGIIAGNGAQSAGAYEGVAPGVRVLSVKVTTDDGRASYSSIIGGLQWIVANARTYNIRVANLSLGAAAVGSFADDPLDGAVEVAWFRGITVVAAAGNSGPNAGTIAVPGNDPYIITVGAFDDNQTAATNDDVIPDWSARGPTAYDGFAKPDIVASGRRVVSLRVQGSYLDTTLPDRVTANNYFRLSGTSMASPVVAGVAALVIAQNRNLTPNQVKYILKQSARPMAFGQNVVGSGAVDALAAVQMAARGTPGDKANKNQVPNKKFASAIWSVLQTMDPIWRSSTYGGRSWVNGSWSNGGWTWTPGYWSNGSWVNGSWSNGSWTNGSWTNGGWDNVAWENLGWENLGWETADWDNGSWDNLSWENVSWDSGSWDSGSWDNGSWESVYGDPADNAASTAALP